MLFQVYEGGRAALETLQPAQKTHKSDPSAPVKGAFHRRKRESLLKVSHLCSRIVTTSFYFFSTEKGWVTFLALVDSRQQLPQCTTMGLLRRSAAARALLQENFGPYRPALRSSTFPYCRYMLGSAGFCKWSPTHWHYRSVASVGPIPYSRVWKWGTMCL